MTVLSLLAPLLFAVALSQDCGWVDPVSQTHFNLSKLTLLTGFYQSAEGGYEWEMNVCHTVSTASCQSEEGVLCQYQGQEWIAAWATWDRSDQEEKYPTWSLIDAANPKQGVKLNFTNGAPSCYFQGRKYPRASLIKFVCKAGQANVSTFTIAPDANIPCLYQVEIESEHACPVGSEDDAAATSKGLSPGSFILITLAIVIPLYIIIGCIYKTKTAQTKGTESCPNIEFWRDLPALVKDGFTYTFRCCKKGSGNAYEEL